jgi:hypothetical protein
VLTASASAVPRGIVGVVHLPALPGDPGFSPGTAFADVLDFARRDATALAEGGCVAIIVENFGSTPFCKGTADDRLPAEQVAAMSLAVAAIAGEVAVPLGVNCLRNDARAALSIAAVTGAAFVRVNVHAGAYVTDQGIIEGEAAATLRHRRALGAEDVAILADVLVKHAAPLAEVSVRDATHDCLHRGRADAVIVTGAATGAPVDRQRLQQVREAAGDAPVLLGSGTTPDNAAALGPLVDGAIVGTYFKRDGVLSAPVDVERVRRVVAAFAEAAR